MVKSTDFVGDCGIGDESRVSLERTTRPFVCRPRSLTGRLAGAKEMESHVVWKSLRSGKMAWTGDHALSQTTWFRCRVGPHGPPHDRYRLIIESMVGLTQMTD